MAAPSRAPFPAFALQAQEVHEHCAQHGAEGTRLGDLGDQPGDALGGALVVVLLGEVEHGLLVVKVVLDGAHGHPSLGRDVAQAGRLQPMGGDQAQHRLADVPAPLLVVNLSWHLRLLLLSCGRIAKPSGVR
jgi:hypothetical protein